MFNQGEFNRPWKLFCSVRMACWFIRKLGLFFLEMHSEVIKGNMP